VLRTQASDEEVEEETGVGSPTPSTDLKLGRGSCRVSPAPFNEKTDDDAGEVPTFMFAFTLALDDIEGDIFEPNDVIKDELLDDAVFPDEMSAESGGRGPCIGFSVLGAVADPDSLLNLAKDIDLLKLGPICVVEGRERDIFNPEDEQPRSAAFGVATKSP
jgi:hypothetical protein